MSLEQIAERLENVAARFENSKELWAAYLKGISGLHESFSYLLEVFRQEREGWGELLAEFFSLEDRRRMEQAIRENFEEQERRERRRKRFPNPGGFNTRGRVATVRERTEGTS